MPASSSLPKGSATVRGSSDVNHIRSLGGQSANTANHLYMFVVRRESLLNKKRSLEIRLGEINQQLRGLKGNIKETAGKLGKSLKLPTRKKTQTETGYAPQGKTMTLKF